MTFGPDPHAVYPIRQSNRYVSSKIITRPGIQVSLWAIILITTTLTGRRISRAVLPTTMRFWATGSSSASFMPSQWEKYTPTIEELPFKGDTVVGSDVWDRAERDGHARRTHRRRRHCRGVQRGHERCVALHHCGWQPRKADPPTL